MKRFAESAIALKDRYTLDIFYRTQLNIIGLQVLFVAGLILFVWISLLNVQQNLREGMALGIGQIFETNGEVTGQMVQEYVNSIRYEKFTLIFFVLVALTILFGYLVSRITLAPARRALDAQKKFISNVAHEVRTPLTIIRTNIEVNLLNPNVSEQQRLMHASNLEELDRISNIINNLLSFNNFYRGARMQFHNVNMSVVLDTVVEKLSKFAESKKTALSVDKGEYTMVWGNETALEQVVMNLVKNAIKYTNEGGEVSIVLAPNYHSGIELIVKDNGIGIYKEDLYHIFEPFYKADRSRTGNGSSSGMGLAIVNEIIKIHKGSITIKSAVGRGTTATIVLPIGTDPSDQSEGAF